MRASNSLRISDGRGAPPDRQNSSDCRSSGASLGYSSKAWNRLGTPGNWVGWRRFSAFMTMAISKRGSSTSSAPISMPMFITTVMAKTWNRGSTPMMRSSPSFVSGSHMATWRALAAMLAWVSMAPMGMPVVPPVYCRTAMSSRGEMSAGWKSPSLSVSSAKATCSPSSGSSAMRPRPRNLNRLLLANGSASAMEQTTTRSSDVRPSDVLTLGRVSFRSMVTMIRVSESWIWRSISSAT